MTKSFDYPAHPVSRAGMEERKFALTASMRSRPARACTGGRMLSGTPNHARPSFKPICQAAAEERPGPFGSSRTETRPLQTIRH